MIGLRHSPRGRLRLMVCAALVLTAGAADAQVKPPSQQDDLRAFPTPGPGQARLVIRLPTERNEDDLRVGFVVGRTMWVDCNRQIFPARVEERTAEGWGYTYYFVTSSGAPASTMMACPSNARTRQFVRNREELVRYNSRLPLVIITPADVEVRYRIWRAGPETTAR